MTKIKVKVDDTWKMGSLLEGSTTEGLVFVGIGEPHHWNYEVRVVPERSTKRFTEIASDVAEAQHRVGLEQALQLTTEALAELLPGETVELVTDGHSDPSIRGYHGAVTIDPVVFEVESIAGFIERAGYQVTIWKYHHATRQQPEEYTDAPVGTYGTPGAAVQVFIQTIFKLKASDYWDHKADEAQAAEWEEGEPYTA